MLAQRQHSVGCTKMWNLRTLKDKKSISANIGYFSNVNVNQKTGGRGGWEPFLVQTRFNVLVLHSNKSTELKLRQLC